MEEEAQKSEMGEAGQLDTDLSLLRQKPPSAAG